MRHHAGDRFDVYSAGTEPKGVNPLSWRVLEEVGVDASGLRSKGVTEFLGKLPVAHLIIVCGEAEKACPRIWPGVRERHFWPFDDPAAVTGSESERLEAFRRVRDEIDSKIRDWLRS